MLSEISGVAGIEQHSRDEEKKEEDEGMKVIVRRIMRRFRSNEEGLETVEYAIITGLIVAATIVVIAAIGIWVLETFQTLQVNLGA